MDEVDQARIFGRIQEKFDIEDITQTTINEYLKNKPQIEREYTWEERRRGKLRTRTRKYKTKGFSSKKDAIAKDMSGISRIYEDAKTKVTKPSNEFSAFGKKWVITPENQNKIKDRITDRLIDLQEDSDLSGLKEIEVKDKEIQEQVDNRTFNTAMQRQRELRDEVDIKGLQDLKGEVRGIKDETEIVSTIDATIERLLEKHAR